MNDSMCFLQITKCIERGYCHLPADFFRYRFLEKLEEFIEAGSHELHADPDITGRDEASQTHHDLPAVVRLEHHVHVHHDALGLLRVARPPHLFAGDDLPRLGMFHLDDVAAGSVAEISEGLEVLDGGFVCHSVDLEHPGEFHNVLQLSLVDVLRRLRERSESQTFSRQWGAEV